MGTPPPAWRSLPSRNGSEVRPLTPACSCPASDLVIRRLGMMGEEPVLCVRSTVDLLSGRFGMLGKSPSCALAAQWIHLPLAARARSWLARISPSWRRRGLEFVLCPMMCHRRRGCHAPYSGRVLEAGSQIPQHVSQKPVEGFLSEGARTRTPWKASFPRMLLRVPSKNPVEGFLSQDAPTCLLVFSARPLPSRIARASSV